jgi:serine/threonine protein phosphatase PrpC
MAGVMKLAATVAGFTDQGKARSNNEDAICVDAELGLIIVADGMGGHQAGEVASGMAVSTIPEHFRQMSRTGSAGEVTENHFSIGTNRLGYCLKVANQTIFETAKRSPQDQGMGTTCTAALIEDDRVGIAHVGDSRCYLIRQGEMELLTNDHSLVMEQIRSGLISKDDEIARSAQNILTRSLGTAEEVEVDVDEHPLFPGDVLLLCSDGLGKELSDDKILQVVNEAPDPADLAKRLIQLANTAGGRDNITVAAVRLDKAGLGQSIKGFFKSITG